MTEGPTSGYNTEAKNWSNYFYPQKQAYAANQLTKVFEKFAVYHNIGWQ